MIPADRCSSARGFTLVEVLVATVVASIVVLAARGLYDALTSHLERVARVALEADRQANGARLLRQVVRDVEAHIDADSSLVGDVSSAAFVSSCQSPWGWLERRHVTLSVVDSARWSLVVVKCAPKDSAVAMRESSPVALRYLTSEEQGSAWVESWSAGQMPPRAIGVHTASNIVILPIAVRW